MKKSIIFLLLLLVVPFLGASTLLKVGTLPNHGVSASVLVPSEDYELIDSVSGASDPHGLFSSEFEGGEYSVVDIKIYIRSNGNLVLVKRFYGLPIGAPINLEVYPEGYVKPPPVIEPIENVSDPELTLENNTEEVNVSETLENASALENEETQGASITGLSTTEDTGILSGGIFLYIVGVVVVFAIVFVGVMSFKRKKTSSKKEIKVKKLSELNREKEDSPDKKDKIDDYKQAIDDAERKIEEAQKEIRKLRNEGKITEMRKKLEDDQKALEKLEKGED